MLFDSREDDASNVGAVWVIPSIQEEVYLWNSVDIDITHDIFSIW